MVSSLQWVEMEQRGLRRLGSTWLPVHSSLPTAHVLRASTASKSSLSIPACIGASLVGAALTVGPKENWGSAAVRDASKSASRLWANMSCLNSPKSAIVANTSSTSVSSISGLDETISANEATENSGIRSRINFSNIASARCWYWSKTVVYSSLFSSVSSNIWACSRQNASTGSRNRGSTSTSSMAPTIASNSGSLPSPSASTSSTASGGPRDLASSVALPSVFPSEDMNSNTA
mmetsp:Transcript_8581/g.26979  ORF Transcript_8581/g.26979 Transcript_8581/m.26979 type:complete len:234 (+) Transcript_8581:698-1399(+)